MSEDERVPLPNTTAAASRFVTRPRPLAWVVPICLAVLGVLPLTFLARRADVVVVCGAILVGAAYLTLQVLASRITIDGDLLCVRHYLLRKRCMRLYGLRAVGSHRDPLSSAPVLDLTALDGGRVSIRLGSWRREDKLLTMLAGIAERAQSTIDPETSDILRDRPTADAWPQRNAGRPSTRVGRAFARLPRWVRWPATIVLYIGVFIGLYVGVQLASVISENVLFPRQVDAAWTDRHAIPAGIGDTWVGNLATSDGALWLATREDIDGVWGTIKVRASEDGAQWSRPMTVSGIGDAARHTLISGSDGDLWAAWSQRGPEPATQRLVVRRSVDGGQSWLAPAVVATPAGGLVAVPALIDTGRMGLIAYTDGKTGEIWTQPLTVDGDSDRPATRVDVTTRQLYSDAVFADGLPALTMTSGRAVLAYVSGRDDVHIAMSDDLGRTWQQREIDQNLYGGRPRLAANGSTVVLAVSDPNSSSRNVRNPFVRIWWSADLARTWVRGLDVSGVAELGDIELTWVDGAFHLIYSGCPGAIRCATEPRVWYSRSSDGARWSESVVITEPGDVVPVGIAVGDGRLSAVWAIIRSDHDWEYFASRHDGS